MFNVPTTIPDDYVVMKVGRSEHDHDDYDLQQQQQQQQQELQQHSLTIKQTTMNPNKNKCIPLLALFVTTAVVFFAATTTTTTTLLSNNHHDIENQQLSDQQYHHRMLLSGKDHLSKMDIKRRLQDNDDDNSNDDNNDDNTGNDDDNTNDNDDGTYSEDASLDCDEHNFQYKEAMITPDFYDTIYNEEMTTISERASVTEDEDGLISITQQSSVLKCHQTNIPVRLSGKKGIGLGINPLGQTGGTLEDYTSLLLNLNVQWSYNWRLSSASNLPNDNDYLPMVFSVRDSTDTMIQSLRDNNFPERFFDGSVHTLLGFNEPDATSASVETAIERWNFLHQYNIPLVSPSCVNPLGDWMKTFMQRAEEECRRVDYIGVHWYGGPNYQNFVNWMTLIYTTYNIPIIITEFSPADWRATTLANNRHTPEEVLNFAKSALPWLERTEFIVGYSWFSFIPTNPVGWSSSLFDTNGNLSVLGQYYQSVTPSNPDGDRTIQF